MQLQGAQREAGALPSTVAKGIETAIDLARLHLTEARRSVGALRPNVASAEDIATALKRLAETGRRTANMPIELEIDEIPRLGDGVEREIVGIAQEALTNAVRHSRARRITIRASTVQSVGLRLSITDDGRGHRARRGDVRVRHDEHAGARRSHRRVVDHRDRPAQRHRDRPRVGSVFAADAGTCRKLTPSRSVRLQADPESG